MAGMIEHELRKGTTMCMNGIYIVHMPDHLSEAACQGWELKAELLCVWFRRLKQSVCLDNDIS